MKRYKQSFEECNANLCSNLWFKRCRLKKALGADRLATPVAVALIYRKQLAVGQRHTGYLICRSPASNPCFSRILHARLTARSNGVRAPVSQP